ncbi:MAG: recombinase family protein [Chloroflexi bacterium]|nr:recombinase family protein [Chloroflexota bacterium]
MTFRACVYAAVSTEEQTGPNKASLDDQLTKCREVCAVRGWPIVAEVSVAGHSRNYSWLHEIVRDSPDYARLVSLIEQEQIDLIVTVAHDRLWRTDALRAQLTALCRQHRVQIFALAMPQEPTTEVQRADSHLLVEALSGVISQIENETRVRRAQVGMAHRIRRGLYNCARVPYGYRKISKDEPLQIDPDEARWVRWMYERRAEGWGYQAIIHGLNDQGVSAPRGGRWSYGTVRKMLSNDVCRPMSRLSTWTCGIACALWAQPVALTTSPKTAPIMPYPACASADFGWGMGYITSKKNGRHYRYLRCNKYSHYAGRQCEINSVVADDLEALVFEAVHRLLSAPDAWQPPDDDGRADDLTAIESRLSAVASRWDRAYTVYLDGLTTRDEFAATRADLAKIRTTLTEERDRIRRAAERQTAFRRRLYDLSSHADNMAALDADGLRALYAQLIDRVVVWPDQAPRIDWLA